MSLLPERGTFKGLNELGFDYLNQSEEPFEEKKFRSPPTEVDEREIFKGSENHLTMRQTYTHKFQCQYQLMTYPFDEQVYTQQGLFLTISSFRLAPST